MVALPHSKLRINCHCVSRAVRLVSTYWTEIMKQNRRLPSQILSGSEEVPASPASPTHSCRAGTLRDEEERASQTLAARTEGIRWSRDSWAGRTRRRGLHAGAATKESESKKTSKASGPPSGRGTSAHAPHACALSAPPRRRVLTSRPAEAGAGARWLPGRWWRAASLRPGPRGPPRGGSRVASAARRPVSALGPVSAASPRTT